MDDSMKKAIVSLFCAAMLAAVLSGCGEQSTGMTESQAQVESQALQQIESEEQAASKASSDAQSKACSQALEEQSDNQGGGMAKPVIYLYPAHKMEVSVKINLKGTLSCTYPAYNGGWDVTANPDGHIINLADKKEYSYLFWEGVSDTKYDLSKGFVVAGNDTAAFLQKELALIGLTPREYNEFIVYWLPKMQGNRYNLITFQSKAYTDAAKLDITPKPDSELRVFMVYKPLEKKIDLPQQKLQPFERKGFTVIEWGASQVH